MANDLLQGSPILEEKHGIQFGRLSGCSAFCSKILAKKPNALFKTNCIEDWESKIDAIVEETFNENMTVISGIPSWVKCILSDWSKKEEAVGDILKISTCLFMGCQL
jgi:hypothetical protein